MLAVSVSIAITMNLRYSFKNRNEDFLHSKVAMEILMSLYHLF